MIEKLKTTWRTEAPFVLAMIKRLAVPAVLAALYGAWDWYSSKGAFSLSAYVKLILPTLFFIMWLVGLFEREKKRATDKESFASLSTGLTSLTELVKGLSGSPHAGESAPTAVGSSYSAALINEAFVVFAAGHKLAALLQAGVAFEQAVRAFARRRGVGEADQMPLLRILQKVDFLLPKGWQKEFHTLRQIRNQLTHASEQEFEKIQQPEVVLNTYARAIEALNEHRDD